MSVEFTVFGKPAPAGSKRSGKCSVCKMRVRLRKNGRLGRHYDWYGWPCRGVGARPQ